MKINEQLINYGSDLCRLNYNWVSFYPILKYYRRFTNQRPAPVIEKRKKNRKRSPLKSKSSATAGQNTPGHAVITGYSAVGAITFIIIDTYTALIRRVNVIV